MYLSNASTFFCEFFLFPNSVSHLVSVHFCVLWSICLESCCLETTLEEHSLPWPLGDLRLLMRSWQKSLACSPSTDFFFKVTINICLGTTHSHGHKSIGCKVGEKNKQKKPWENSKFYKSMPNAGGTKKVNLQFFFLREPFTAPHHCLSILIFKIILKGSNICILSFVCLVTFFLAQRTKVLLSLF